MDIDISKEFTTFDLATANEPYLYLDEKSLFLTFLLLLCESHNVMLYDRDGGLSRDCWSHLLLPASCDGRVFQEFAQFQRESAFGVSTRGPPSYLSGMLPSLREQATNLLQILGKCFNVSTTASIFRT